VVQISAAVVGVCALGTAAGLYKFYWRSVEVDLSEFNGPKSFKIPIQNTSTVQSFLDEIYNEIEKTADLVPYTYGSTWLLANARTGASFNEIGTQWADRNGQPYRCAHRTRQGYTFTHPNWDNIWHAG
jgi:hypothetical protein